MDFNPTWISWIMQCIKTVSFSVLVNGRPGNVFTPTRGIRHGDPLSPYIFIMCAEVLARSLQKNGDLSSSDIGIKIGHGLEKIPFPTFADDTIIFAKASNQSCKTIKSILDKFCMISGQFVNFDQSTFQCTRNIDRSLRGSFRGILGMNEEAHLGRLVLVNANLAAKGTFQIQSFLLPSSIHNKLDKSNRDFLWNKNPSQRSSNFIGWHKVCLPKSLGELGIKPAEVANKALQMKLLWKILMKKDNIWVKVIVNIPLPHNDIPDTLLWGLSVDENFSTKTATCLNVSLQAMLFKYSLLVVVAREKLKKLGEITSKNAEKWSVSQLPLSLLGEGLKLLCERLQQQSRVLKRFCFIRIVVEISSLLLACFRALSEQKS
ncbi:uncharacterized protein LOC141637301 [Silene latifolia]|uniref:uncharacterized protein LOC141637301 n=1 Tax=Silene latifolia TaxID=37657 RepID=UPI003D775836